MRGARRALTLVGLSGTGKSTVARLLGERWGWTPVDLDTEIEAIAGCSIPEIFTGQGEAAFRRLEQESLQVALEREGVIIATGGGAPCAAGAMAKILAAGPAVWLQACPLQLQQRLQGAEVRPLLQAASTEETCALLAHQLELRSPVYAKATFEVHTDGRTPLEVALGIEGLLGGTTDGPWKP